MKITLKRLMAPLALGLAFTLAAGAAIPAPDQLLPDDTLGLITIPDYSKATATSQDWPVNQLWNDPAIKPFRDKLAAKIRSDLIQPLEQELGIRLTNYTALAQGQVTLAVLRNGWDAGTEAEPAFLFLVDSREKSDALTKTLADLRRTWQESGKQPKPATIRGVEFTALSFSSDDLSKALEGAFPDPDAGYESLTPPKPEKPGKTLEWLVGQSDSLLILGNSASAIEKVLVRQSGGGVPSLREQTRFAQHYAGDFRNALGYAWVDLETIFDVLTRTAAAEADANPNTGSMAPRGDRILSALGLNSMKFLGLSLKEEAQGSLAQVFIGSPESARRGIMKLLTFEARDASPPSFIPAEAVKFSRWRLDLQQVVNTAESILVEAAPQFAGVIKLLVDNAGKDKDPNFDLRQNLIGNLGNDIISFEKLPRTRTVQDLNSPPSLVLVSSPRPEQLASALKAVTALLPTQSMRVKQREFLGRTVYTMDLPATTAPGSSKPVQRSLNFAASGGYVAITTDEAMLEEYLRSSSGTGKSLAGEPGLAQAADAVGGMRTGLFGYENQRETSRLILEILKKESGTIGNLLSATPLALRLGIDEDEENLKDWLDFSLLPSFDQIAKYFYISVFSGTATADGLSFKVYTPDPPALR